MWRTGRRCRPWRRRYRRPWVFLLRQQRGRGHHLSRLAVTALRHVELLPRGLHGGRFLRLQAFDGRDFHAGLQRRQRRHAGARGLPVEVDGAGAAQRHAATVLGAGEIEVVAQDPEERGIAGHAGRDVHTLLVDEIGRHSSSPGPRIGRCDPRKVAVYRPAQQPWCDRRSAVGGAPAPRASSVAVIAYNLLFCKRNSPWKPSS